MDLYGLLILKNQAWNTFTRMPTEGMFREFKKASDRYINKLLLLDSDQEELMNETMRRLEKEDE
jgi:hypothetical protein